MVTRREVLGLLGAWFIRPQMDGTDVATVTLTGDLLTDAVRSAATEYDGRAVPDSSVGIYPDRESWLPNGAFQVDTRHWNMGFGAVTRQQDNVLPGKTYGGRGTVTSSGQTAYVQVQGFSPVSPVPQTPVTFAAYVVPSADLVGERVTAYLLEYGGASGSGVMGNLTRNFTLTEGENVVSCTAIPTEDDRTGAYGRLQLAGYDAGVYLDVLGADIWQSPVVLPHIDANEVRDEYDPSPDLLTNGDFEANVSGWTGFSATISQSAEQAKGGTGSLKGVATATGSIWAESSYSASPVPVDTYGCGGWMYATPELVGKTAQINLIESGGAVVAANIGVDGPRILDAGWNYFLTHGTVQQSDRTKLIVRPFVNGAAVGDRFYYDKMRMGAGYAAPAPTLVSKEAGRIQVPMNGLHTNEGWFAIGVRPAWATTDGSGRFRPTMPVTIWQWADDTQNYLRLRFDGGLLSMERCANGVSETAKSPWAPANGTAATIVVRWDQYGVYLSVEGRAFVGQFVSIATDTFARADTSGGLGTTETGGKTWSVGGASLPRIAGNRYTPHASTNGTGYAYLALGEVPARFGGVVSYVDGGGGGNGNHTLACADAVGSLATLLHLFLSRTSANYQWRDNGGDFNNYTGITTVSTIPTDGTGVETYLTMQGDTLAITQGGESYSFKHESIERLASQYVFWEVGRANGATGQASRWDSIFADRYGNWTSASASIPALAATHADIGSNGDGTGHFCGDVLWFAAGRGTLTDDDVTALAALEGDPDARNFPAAVALPSVIWPADTTALWTYAAAGASSSAEMAQASSTMAAMARPSSSSTALARASSTTTEIT